MATDDKLTIERSMTDLKRAYAAKRKLIEREREDFLFALGEQWSLDDKQKLEKAGIKPVTDNRIQPNLFLLTGLERQNRSDFKAFPEGEEDGIKADIASALFRDAIKKSGFRYKSSEQFKDGITCGESHLELYLDYNESLINGKPCWRKCDGNTIFPDPSSREYDFSDGRFVYKVTFDLSREDLISLYPDMRKEIEKAESGKLDMKAMLDTSGTHRQPKDYPQSGTGNDVEREAEGSFDLIERVYKKWVETVFIGDKQTGDIRKVEDDEAAKAEDKAKEFIQKYQDGINQNQQAYQHALDSHGLALQDHANKFAGVHPSLVPQQPKAPPPPPQQDPKRFTIIKRKVPEMWCFAHAPGVAEPLCDERAWFYPKWKTYPFVTYFARFSTAPLTGEDRHLLVQGLVHGVKGVQEKHNKAEMLMLRHLNTSTNSGWLAEEDAWVDPAKAEAQGTAAGVNLEHKKGTPPPQRIAPTPLSQGHAQIAAESAEAIKAQLGINADLLATQQGGSDSGRAIALRQRQGLLMVQELFDNLSRSRETAGRFILSQLGEIYDTETAMKVLGDAFLKKNFPPPMMNNPDDPHAPPQPLKDNYGQPMQYDKEMAEVAIAEVLGGELEEYDISVGEAVASETQLMATSAEIKDLNQSLPGIVSPDLLVRYANIPESAKREIQTNIKAQQAAMMAGGGPPRPPAHAMAAA